MEGIKKRETVEKQWRNRGERNGEEKERGMEEKENKGMGKE